MKLDLNKLITDIGESAPVYIYGFGLAGRWLSAHLPDRVFGFIDTDLKKRGMSFDSIKVMSLPDARECVQNNAIIIISVIDIQDVSNITLHIPNSRSIAMGLYLQDGATGSIQGIPESLDFIDYSLSAVKEYHTAFYDKGKLFLRSVDVMITERCTLKCRDCSNLMQYYERPENIDKQEVLRDLDELLTSVDHIFEIRLIGGEPFMNKDIYEIIESITSIAKISRLVVFSNAMVPFRDGKISALAHPKVVLSLTNYGDLAKKTLENVSRLDKLGIPYRLHPPENWTDSGVIHDFGRTDAENQQLFENCCGKNLLTLSRGRLYRCPFAANADRLGAIPDDPSNSVQSTEGADVIRRYTREIRSLPACNFCKGRSFDAPEIEPALQAPQPLPYRSFRLESMGKPPLTPPMPES